MNLKQTLEGLRTFVKEEHEANQAKLHEIWEKPLSKKLQTGETQAIAKLNKVDKSHLTLTLGQGSSRFREGDMICLHYGDAENEICLRQGTIEGETEDEWLVRFIGQELDCVVDKINIDRSIKVYADPDGMDLKPFFDKSLDDVTSSKIGTEFILPLLSGDLDSSSIYNDDFDDAADFAEECGLNDQQIEAVGLGVGAKYLACIQGPPGTGKTKVISLIANLLVKQRQRVFVTSHTHMAINNALNKISEQHVPIAKVGPSSSVKALADKILRFEQGDDWEDRTGEGYVIGATPFATCTSRLENFQFDTVIFDEASQITVPLAVMAMRKAKRYIFVGDHKQLPPVVLSKSILSKDSYSVFAKLTAKNKETSVMLSQTYRMSKFLSAWPSKKYYDNDLKSAGENAERTFSLPKPPSRFSEILSKENSIVFIKSPGVNARTSSREEAKLVANIVETLYESGLALDEVGVVTPFRNHGKSIRNELAKTLGSFKYKNVVTDTVERMQGQEREVIILSLCSTDKQFISAIADFFFQSERLNVAVTRPKTKLIIIGPVFDSYFEIDSKDENIKEKLADYRDLVRTAYTYSIDCICEEA